MSQHFVKLVCAWGVLCAFGCAQQKVEEPGKPFEITLQSGDAPVAGVPVKIIDEPSAARAIITLALREDAGSSLPKALDSVFFEGLNPDSGAEAIKTDRNGKVAVNRLRAQHFVIARDGQHLWAAAASKARDRKLQLARVDSGGRHALDLLAAQPAVLSVLTDAALESVRHGKPDQARAIAHCAGSKMLLTNIDREEAVVLLSEAQQALQYRDFDVAYQFAVRADALVPNQAKTKELLRSILLEYGGELRTLTGHQGMVTSVAYSPEGKYVLTGSEDRTLKLWDTASGKEVRTFTGHRGSVTSVAFSPDGTMALSGSGDSTLRLWDVASGRELHATEGLGWKITCVAFSPDGTLIASAAADNQIKLWQLPKVEPVRSLAGHGWRVTSVAFSPDGNYSLSGSEDDSLKLWDVAKGQELRTFRNGLADVTCVAFSPDGRFGLSGGRDKTVKLWNLDNGREVAVFGGHTQPVRSVAFTGDGRFAISASEDGSVKVRDLNTGVGIRTFTGHAAAVTGIAMSPDGHNLASASADGSVKIWQLPRQVWPPVEQVKK
jgi:tricorn protease-like protein